VLFDWTLDLAFPRDIAQIQSLGGRRIHVHHYEPGETIIRKNEIGRELFAVKSGEVEVFQPAEGGLPERRVALLRPGEVFGEKALIEDTPRTASVRARTPVDALVLSREDFRALIGQFEVLGSYFERLMRDRYGKPGEAARTSKAA
jgi:NADH dehydrogenase